jgi:hypothetical protein
MNIDDIKVGAKIGLPSRRWSPNRKNGRVWFTISEVSTIKISNPGQVEMGLEAPGYWIALEMVEDLMGKTWYGRKLHLYNGKLRGSIYGESACGGYPSHYCELVSTRRAQAASMQAAWHCHSFVRAARSLNGHTSARPS